MIEDILANGNENKYLFVYGDGGGGGGGGDGGGGGGGGRGWGDNPFNEYYVTRQHTYIQKECQRKWCFI